MTLWSNTDGSRSGSFRLEMHLKIDAYRTGRRRDLGRERIAEAVRRSLQDFQDAVRIRKIVPIQRQIVMPGTHSYRGLERAIRGPDGVVGEPRGHIAQVTPIETQVAGVIGDHRGIFASEID